MGGYHSEKTGHSLDLRASEVESHVEGQQVEVTSECIAGFILPSDVHGGWRQVVIPRVPDVLADAIKKVVHCEGFKAMSIEKYIVGEQGSCLHPVQGWCDLTCCCLHDITVDLGHKWTNREEIHNHQYFPESEVPEVLQVLDHKIVPVVGVEDVATYGRHVNENVQERFEHELMNEP